jgi:hypothetical protein
LWSDECLALTFLLLLSQALHVQACIRRAVQYRRARAHYERMHGGGAKHRGTRGGEVPVVPHDPQQGGGKPRKEVLDAVLTKLPPPTRSFRTLARRACNRGLDRIAMLGARSLDTLAGVLFPLAFAIMYVTVLTPPNGSGDVPSQCR